MQLLEILLPILFIYFLVLIKNSVEGTDGFEPEIVEAKFPSNSDVLATLSFGDYVTTLQSKRICQKFTYRNMEISRISGLPVMGMSGTLGTNAQVPFLKCDSRLCKDAEDAQEYCEYLALGVAASSESDTVGAEQAKAFQEYVYTRYPVLANNSLLPFDFEFVQMFDSDRELEDYVKSSDYNDLKLALGVVFDGTDASFDYNFRIRVNSTGFNAPEDTGRPGTFTTPPTEKTFERFAKDDDSSCPELVGGTPYLGPYSNSCTGRYIYNGALVLQRLVNDFIMVESGAKDEGYFVGEHGVRYVP